MLEINQLIPMAINGDKNALEIILNDIQAGYIDNTDELLMGESEEEMAQELKLYCTNIILQYPDTKSRCIFILGTMFKVKSELASEILNISPENHHQILSRSRRKMARFLNENCGLCGGNCSCQKRVGYAISQHRIHPHNKEFKRLKRLNTELLKDYMKVMEDIEEESSFLKT